MTPCQEMDVVIDPGAAEMYNQRLSGVRTHKNVLENASVASNVVGIVEKFFVSFKCSQVK